MGSFYLVTSGASTNANDVNQYASALDGTTGVQAKLLSQNNATSALQAILSSAPTTDQSVVDVLVASDANARVAHYIRGSDGYGGIRAGAGTGAATAHLYAQATGWRVDESVAIGGALNVTGATTLAGVNSGAHVASSLQSNGTLAVAGTSSLDNGAIATNGVGGLVASQVYVNQPPILRAGNQETGVAGLAVTNSSPGVAYGLMVNFKTVLTNTPTSVTFVVLAGANNNGASTNLFSIYGFNFFTTSVAGGTSSLQARYTTAGNCLLAVDPAARTFDHHCDACGHVTRGAAFADLTITTGVSARASQALVDWAGRPSVTSYPQRFRAFLARLAILARLARRASPTPARASRNSVKPAECAPGTYNLSYRCLKCGAVECYNTSLDGASEAITTPQGEHTPAFATTYGEQAQRIRALQGALGLPVKA